jgi:hypothetical protein
MVAAIESTIRARRRRRRCKRRLSAALALTVLLAVNARGAQDVDVEAQRQGDALAISAHATIQAPLAVIWRTLTDYNHLADFIPGMKESRVLSRHGGTAVVEQIGEASFLLFRYPISVIVQSDEHYPTAIGVRVLSGNLRQLAGGYRIEGVPGGHGEFRLEWRGIIEPDIALPLFVTAYGLRQAVAEQFLGMVNEIERRRPAPAQN